MPYDINVYGDKPKCFDNHMGLWMAERRWLDQTVIAAKQGLLKMHAGISVVNVVQVAAQDPAAEQQRKDRKPFTVTPEGIAIISIAGPMMKAPSKFDDAVSTLNVRRLISAALRDEDVKAIMLLIESPGGHVAGTAQLADDIRDANAIKPTFAHIEDLGASAAFWVASQARRITANRMAQVGSIGTFTVLHDLSKAFEREGIVTHVLSTGKFKGAGVAGAELSKAFLDQVQLTVDELNEEFLGAIVAGRNMSRADLDEIADGRVFKANKAQELGLIDEVMSFADALAFAAQQIDQPKARTAQARIRIAQAKAAS